MTMSLDLKEMLTVLIEALGVLCNAALVIVGIWGIRTAVRTLRAIERQADEMVKQAALMKEQTAIAQKAAEAASSNAQSVINAERPWLLIEPSYTVNGMRGVPAASLTIKFKATNVGRSPAEVIYAALDWRHLLLGQELLDEPFFSENAPVEQQWAHTRWIKPDESFIPEGMDGQCHISSDAAELWKYLIEGTCVLFVMGYIRYRDAISNSVHESRYCYLVSPKVGTMVMAGPPGYNKLT